jgi:NAD(P)-dependent dehydrogenase (short-subunit alcohol dehydrogenase family)
MLPVEQQTILITGATSGLGRAMALDLAARGATLLLHGRSADKGAALLKEVAATGNDKSTYLLADFARLSDVHRLAEQAAAADRLDAIINNAGIGIFHREESEDGYEMTFQVDYLAGYILAAKLVPLLAASAPARIVNVSSYGQAPIDFRDPMLTRGFDGMQAYGQAKLAQIMHAFDLAEALGPQGITANAVHPAPYMPTNMVVGRFTPIATIEQGVRNVLRVAVEPATEKVTGRFFNQGDDYQAASQAYDPAARAKLRALSEELTGVPFPAGLPQ